MTIHNYDIVFVKHKANGFGFKGKHLCFSLESAEAKDATLFSYVKDHAEYHECVLLDAKKKYPITFDGLAFIKIAKKSHPCSFFAISMSEYLERVQAFENSKLFDGFSVNHPFCCGHFDYSGQGAEFYNMLHNTIGSKFIVDLDSITEGGLFLDANIK